MSKILLLYSGLKHTQEFVQPLAKRLEAYLSPRSDCVDVRNTITFDERTFFEYDQVVFIFTTAMDSIPSSTLEIFEKIHQQQKNSTEIYALIACDTYETEKCDFSAKVIERWCEREHLIFKGTLKVGSVFIIMKTWSRFVVTNYIKNFASAICEHQFIHLRISTLSERIFLKHANEYWLKEIKKKQKEKLHNR